MIYLVEGHDGLHFKAQFIANFHDLKIAVKTVLLGSWLA
jgi:hypothetical protein